MAFAADLGHDAGLGQGFGRGDFDVQPGAKVVLVTPDAAHLGAGITCDQRSSFAGSGLEERKPLIVLGWRDGSLVGGSDSMQIGVEFSLRPLVLARRSFPRRGSPLRGRYGWIQVPSITNCGMARLPVRRMTSSAAPGVVSMFISLNGMSCFSRKRFAVRQSGHQGAE